MCEELSIIRFCGGGDNTSLYMAWFYTLTVLKEYKSGLVLYFQDISLYKKYCIQNNFYISTFIHTDNFVSRQHID